MSNKPANSPKDGPCPVYLVVGNDTQITRDKIGEFINKIIEPPFRELNTQKFDASDEGALGAIIGAMLSPPFWGTRKAILVTRFHEMESASSSKIFDEIHRMPASNVLILWAWKLAANSKAAKAISELGKLIELDAANPATVGRWAEAKAGEFGALLAPDAKMRLLEIAGEDPDRILREIEKLAAFVGKGEGKTPNAITAADVEKLTQDSPEGNVFKILEAIGARNGRDGLACAREALRQGNTPIGIIALIGYQVRNMLLAKTMVDEEKRPLKEFGARLGRAGFRAQRYLSESRNFTKDELVTGLMQVSLADRAIKSGRLPETYAVESLILGLCRQSGIRG